MSKQTIDMDELLKSSDVQQLKTGDVVEGVTARHDRDLSVRKVVSVDANEL